MCVGQPPQLWQPLYLTGFKMQNARGGVNQDCLKAYSEDDAWKCFFAPVSDLPAAVYIVINCQHVCIACTGTGTGTCTCTCTRTRTCTHTHTHTHTHSTPTNTSRVQYLL